MDNIIYTLRGINVEQFATLFEPANETISLNVSILIKTNYDQRSLAVGANIQYLEDEKPFLVAEVFCHYEIDENCWKALSDSCTKDVSFPKEFMDSLARIAIGAVRGVICVKTENTALAKYCLPIIELGEPNNESFVIPKP